MAEIRVTCPTKNLLVVAIPVQFADGEAMVSEEVAEQLRPYVKAHELKFHRLDSEMVALESDGEPKPDNEPKPDSEPKPVGRKRTTSPFGN